jgi:methylmalonyl-CoA mutase N-terminal domain/subunit
MEEPPPTNLLKVDPKQREIETEKLKKLRAERDEKAWKKALDRLAEVSNTDENVMPQVIEAVKARATVGEICDVWRNIWGEYRPKEFV